MRVNISEQTMNFQIEDIKEIRTNERLNEKEVKIHWKGLESIEDTWELLLRMAKEAPDALAYKLRNMTEDENRPLKEALQEALKKYAIKSTWSKFKEMKKAISKNNKEKKKFKTKTTPLAMHS